MTLEDVEALIEAEGKLYPEIDEYYAGLAKHLKKTRKDGRYLPHPNHPGVMCNLGTSTYRTPDGKLYSWREEPSPEYMVKRGVSASVSPTTLKNYPVQGEGGEWMKAAMWIAVREFYRRRNFEGQALLVNTVHDALYVDADNRVAFEAAALLHACMVSANDLMQHTFNWPLPVHVPSDTTWGESMADEDAIDNLHDRATVLREEIKARYFKDQA